MDVEPEFWQFSQPCWEPASIDAVDIEDASFENTIENAKNNGVKRYKYHFRDIG